MVFLEERSLVFLRLFSRPKRLACLLFLARRAPFSSSYPFSLLKNVSGRELVLLGILGPVINGPRMKAIRVAAQAAPVGEIPPDLRSVISNSVLRAYVPIPSLIALGAVIMMVLKLDWLGSGMVIALALIIGLIFAFAHKG